MTDHSQVVVLVTDLSALEGNCLGLTRLVKPIARGREAMHHQKHGSASLARVHQLFSSCRPGCVVQIRQVWSAKARRLTRLVRSDRLRQRKITAMRSGRGRTCSFTHEGDGGGEMLPASGEPPRSRIPLPFCARSLPREPHARIPSTQRRGASTMPALPEGLHREKALTVAAPGGYEALAPRGSKDLRKQGAGGWGGGGGVCSLAARNAEILRSRFLIRHPVFRWCKLTFLKWTAKIRK